MDVGNDEPNEESDGSNGEHVQGNFLRIGPNSVAIEDHVLGEAGQTVDAGPAQSQCHLQTCDTLTL